MLREAIGSVKKFHERIRTFVNVRVSRPTACREIMQSRDSMLRRTGDEVRRISDFLNEVYIQDIELGVPDPRLYRAHLMLGELSELMKAMSARDEVDMLDGCADLLVTTLGTGVTFGLPLNEAFEEVMKSNMTKDGSLDYATTRFKGPDYKKPDLCGVLSRHRVLLDTEVTDAQDTD